MTFAQFVAVVLAYAPLRLSLSGQRKWKKTAIPLHRLFVSAALFYTVNMLNNWAFAFQISVPVHIVLRSFGSVLTMGAGWLRGKRYSPVQVLAVAVLTLGVIISASADAQIKVGPGLIRPPM